MPLFDDYSKDDEERPQGGGDGGSSGGGGGGGAVMYGGASPQHEQAFTPWSRFVSANKSVSDREAGKLESQVQGDVNRATGARDAAAGKQNADIRSNYNGQSYEPGSGSFASNATLGANPNQATGAFGRAQPADGLVNQMQTAPPPPARQSPHGMAPPPTQGRQGNFARELPDANYLSGNIKGDRLRTSPVTGQTTGVGVAGSKDLEAQLGKDAWAKLVGDTQRAQGEANALGSQGGVQAMLQKNGPTPNSAFDAALIGGAGGRDFRDIAKQSGSNKLSQGLANANQTAQGQWHKLMGDIDAAGAARDKAAAPAAVAPGQVAAGAPAGVPADWNPIAATKQYGLTGERPEAWNEGDDQMVKAAMTAGEQLANQNNGKVQIINGPSNQGVGSQGGPGLYSGPGGTAGETMAIQVKQIQSGPDKGKPDYADWWGGSTNLPIGDPSIPAATWYALAQMTPAQRKRWWEHNHPKKD